MSNYIGCKISLISKARIRYEGILYTIDPKESTVALSKVKSFGTEDRKVERPIAARDEIYEYIIFRGSDIADLNVCESNKETTLLNEDSAIVRAGETSVNLPQNVMPNSDDSWLMNKHSLSSPKTNEIELNKQAVPPIGMKLNKFHNDKKIQRKNDKQFINNTEENKSDKNKNKYEKYPKHYDRYQNYYEYDYGYEGNYKYPGYRQMNDYYYTNKNHYSNRQNPKSLNYNGRRGTGNNGYDTHYQNYNDPNNKLRGFESSDIHQNHYYDYRPSRPGNSSGNQDKNQINKNKRRYTNKIEPKKEGFKEDYDFESANAIIAKELENLTLNQEKKENEDIEKEDGEVSECSDTPYYDKAKSFFDNISSEVADRANGKTVRPMNRKEERKMNVETFGIAEANKNIRSGGNRWSRGGGGSNRYNGNSHRRGGGTGNSGPNSTHNYMSNNGLKKHNYVAHNRRVVPPVGGPGRGDDY